MIVSVIFFFFFCIENGILCVLIRIASMRTHNIPPCKENQRDPYCASLPGAIMNPQWLELPLSRTNFHGLKGVRAIEVLL